LPGALGARDAGAAEHRVEQTWEAEVELRAAQRVQARRALEPLADYAGLPEDAEVVGAGRLADGQIDALARPRVTRSEALHDPQPHRVAQCVQDGGELDVLDGRVRQRGRGVPD